MTHESSFTQLTVVLFTAVEIHYMYRTRHTYNPNYLELRFLVSLVLLYYTKRKVTDTGGSVPLPADSSEQSVSRAYTSRADTRPLAQERE